MKWYEHDEDTVKFIQLDKPYSNIIIAEMPTFAEMTKKFANHFDHYVNVSMTPFEVLGYNKNLKGQFHWYPLQEHSFFGFESLYWFKHKLDLFHSRNEKIFVHCEAGINRSPTMGLCWLISRGYTLSEAASIMSRGDEKDTKQKIRLYNRNRREGYIPTIKDLQYFYKNFFGSERKEMKIDGISENDERLGKYYKATSGN